MQESIEQLSLVLGTVKYADGSDEHKFNCPFCEANGHGKDNKWHLYVNPKKEKWICFKCGERGSLDQLLQKLGIEKGAPVINDDEFMKLAKQLEFGIHDEEKLNDVSPSEYPCEVRPVEPGSSAYRYMKYVRGYEYKEFADYKLVYGEFMFSSRIFFPTFDMDGKLCYWVARKIFNDSDKVAKYVNPKAEKLNVFNLNRVKGDHIIICEGVLSAMAAGPEAVAIFGKTATKQQIWLLNSIKFDEYIISLDSDARKEAFSLASEFINRGKKVSLVELPEREDPDSVRKSYKKYLGLRTPITDSELILGGLS